MIEDDIVDSDLASESAEQQVDNSTDSSNDNLDGYVPVSKMNEANAITRKKSFEKGYQRGISEAESKYQSQNKVQDSGQNSEHFDVSKIEKMIEEKAEKIEAQRRAEIEKQQYEEWGRKVESSFLDKAEKVKLENPNFDGKKIVDKASAIAPFAFAYSAELDNSPEVWDHLLKDNPTQVHILEQMVLSGNQLKQQYAFDEIKKVSERLKQNKVGRRSESAPQPLDHVGKTTHGAGTDGDVDDYFRNLHSKKNRR